MAEIILGAPYFCEYGWHWLARYWSALLSFGNQLMLTLRIDRVKKVTSQVLSWLTFTLTWNEISYQSVASRLGQYHGRQLIEPSCLMTWVESRYFQSYQPSIMKTHHWYFESWIVLWVWCHPHYWWCYSMDSDLVRVWVSSSIGHTSCWLKCKFNLDHEVSMVVHVKYPLCSGPPWIPC